MTDEPQPSFWATTDWKALFMAATMFCGALLWVGTLYRDHILGLVDQRIAAHADAATSRRAEFFRDLESKAGGAVSRLDELARHCAEIRSWRPGVDSELEALQTWRSNCSVKVAGIEKRSDADDAAMARIDRELNSLRERVYDLPHKHFFGEPTNNGK